MLREYLDQTFYISSHAPIRGATYNVVFKRACSLEISSHAPIRGATETEMDLPGDTVFQVTPLYEGRHGLDSTQIISYNYFKSRPYTRGDGKKIQITFN